MFWKTLKEFVGFGTVDFFLLPLLLLIPSGAAVGAIVERTIEGAAIGGFYGVIAFAVGLLLLVLGVEVHYRWDCAKKIVQHREELAGRNGK